MLHKRVIDVASGTLNADTVVRGAKVLDVFNRRWMEGDIAIVDGKIAGIGGKYSANEEIDATGMFVTPGLIDAHIHIESTLITPDRLNDVLLPHGVMGLIADPHEIANVAGIKGIEYMIDASEGLELKVYIMLPSCVPSTDMETSGSELNAVDLKPLYAENRVLGLAEVMNAPAVYMGGDMHDKISDAQALGLTVDGHGATLDEKGLNVYAAAGILTDHEVIDKEGMIERIARGMYVHVRQGTVTKNLLALLPGITQANAARICFCTDDKHLNELAASGGIDEVVRLAIKNGLEDTLAFTCATWNPAQCYGLSGYGAIAPGYKADFVLFDGNYHACLVYQSGRLVARDGKVLHKRAGSVKIPEDILNSVNYASVSQESLRLDTKGKRYLNAIGVKTGNIVTKHIRVPVDSDEFTPDADRDLAKLCVVERHHATGRVGVCVVTGFKMRQGAIATTVAHDSHNIICVGMTDEDMLLAIEALKEMDGGYVVVKSGKVAAALRLNVAGLMSSAEPSAVLKDLDELHAAVGEILSEPDFNPFQMLSFISLPVIPELKLTDKGLVNVMNFEFMPAAE